jgi:hypothetical protein
VATIAGVGCSGETSKASQLPAPAETLFCSFAQSDPFQAASKGSQVKTRMSAPGHGAKGSSRAHVFWLFVKCVHDCV